MDTASWLLENAFKSNPLDEEIVWEVLGSSGWIKIKRPIRLTGKSSTQTCEHALSVLMDKRSWSQIKGNRIKALPRRITLTSKDEDKPNSNHWLFKEELAQLAEDYWKLFWDMNNSSMGTEWALTWLEPNKNKAPTKSTRGSSSLDRAT